MKRTRRSNEPYKRAHWKSARTDRRGRFAHVLNLWRNVRDAVTFDVGEEFFEPKDQDLAFRRRGGWLTADKQHLRWAIEHGRIAPAHAHNPLVARVKLRGIRAR